MPQPLKRPFCKTCLAAGGTGWTLLQGQTHGRFLRNGRSLEGDLWRFRCPKYRKNLADEHFHGVVDETGQVVVLRGFRIHVEGKRPICQEPGCHQPMRAGSEKRWKGRVVSRIFACGNRDCRLFEKLRSYEGSWDTGWKRRPRGALHDRQPIGDGICPVCGKPGTLRRHGFFPAAPTRGFPRPMRRVQCEFCGKVFRWDAQRLIPTDKPSTPRGRRESCPRCHLPLEIRSHRSTTRPGGIVYTGRCPSRCGYRLRWLKDGTRLAEPSSRSQPLEPPRCTFPGCNRRRQYPYDERFRYCSTHQGWSRVKRHRTAKRESAKLLEEFDQRYLGPIVARPPVAAGLPTVVADFLRRQLMQRGRSRAWLKREAALDAEPIETLLAGRGPVRWATLSRVAQALGFTLLELRTSIIGTAPNFTLCVGCWKLLPDRPISTRARFHPICYDAWRRTPDGRTKWMARRWRGAEEPGPMAPPQPRWMEELPTPEQLGQAFERGLQLACGQTTAEIAQESGVDEASVLQELKTLAWHLPGDLSLTFKGPVRPVIARIRADLPAVDETPRIKWLAEQLGMAPPLIARVVIGHTEEAVRHILGDQRWAQEAASS